MRHMNCLLSIIAFVAMSPVSADELMIYPSEGQDQATQDKDKYECYGWAKEQSDFDPMAPPTATEAPPQQGAQKGGVGRGALRGAAVGAIIDGSDGAKTGAVAGGAMGGMRRGNQNREEDQERENWEQEQAAIYANQRNDYNRGYAACLQGRGYTVN
jgi:hypothetical protein